MTESESFFEVSEIIRTHVAENAIAYGVAAVFFVIFVFFTRRYTLPVILYAIETLIYLVIMHIVVAGLTSFFAWLHNSTSMQAVRTKSPDVDWDIPLIRFWYTEEYDPNWIYKMEIVFAVLILALVIRYRPMKIQRVRQQTEAAKKGEFKPDEHSTRNRAQELGRKYANPANIGQSGKGKRRF